MKIIIEIPDMEPSTLRNIATCLLAEDAEGPAEIGQALVALACENCEGAKTLGRLNLPCPACHGTGWNGGRAPFPRTRRSNQASSTPEPELPEPNTQGEVAEISPLDFSPTAPEGYGAVYGADDDRAEGQYRVTIAPEDGPGYGPRFAACWHGADGTMEAATIDQMTAQEAQSDLDRWAAEAALPLLCYRRLPTADTSPGEPDAPESNPVASGEDSGGEGEAADDAPTGGLHEPETAVDANAPLSRRAVVGHTIVAKRRTGAHEGEPYPVGTIMAIENGRRDPFGVEWSDAPDVFSFLTDAALDQFYTDAPPEPGPAPETDPFDEIPPHPAATTPEKRKRGRPRKVAGLDNEQPASAEGQIPALPSLPSEYAEVGKQLEHAGNGDLITITEVNQPGEMVRYTTPLGTKGETSFAMLDRFYKLPE